MKQLMPLILTLMCITFCVTTSYGEERDLYIGDPVTIEIGTLSVNEADIRRAFKDFTIHDITNSETGYQVTISTLKTGEHLVEIGGNSILFTVASTLEPYENGDIYEGNLALPDRRLENAMPIVMGISGILALISIIFLIIKYFRNKAANISTPYGRFTAYMSTVNIEDKNSLGGMTKALKLYCAESYEKPLVSLSSADFINEISLVLPRKPNAVITWLSDCDAIKYQDIDINASTIETLKESLLTIVEDLNNTTIIRG